MQAIAAGVQTTVAAWLLLGQPFFGKFKYERLKFLAPTDPGARTRSYLLSLLIEWGLVAAVMVSLPMAKYVPAEIGLRAPAGFGLTLTWGLVAAGLVLAVTMIVSMYRSPEARAAYRESMEKVRWLMPATTGEQFLWTGVAVTAGICEELLFRGFLPIYLIQMLPSLPLWAALLATSVMFGLGHLYQGWRGMVQTGALGAIFAVIFLLTGSLFASMALHALVDLLPLVMLRLVKPDR